ncbi:hypothetical protein [Sulfurovum sp.]|jgi:hypothetical protein|uniref:hypothetical protein n=1 Tax=Sulfurovum sp. TaxID=1969726 RepID=UPI002A3608EA|nr:hypothetical protein [Sulfurovum sp.]MDD2451782.1 hypothetical protein [Sulfurovum sp.]MDY0403333.1 hypothetical protein [Sulfurovum sp.]
MVYHLSKEAPIKTLLLSILLILAFNGCESQSERDARIAQEAREALLAELKAKEEAEKQRESNATLWRLGISKEDGVITIDTNRTKNFFDEMGKQITRQVEAFSEDLDEGRGAGIETNESQIHIDLHKTGDFLERWGKKMEAFADELEDLSKEFDNNESTPY